MDVGSDGMKYFLNFHLSTLNTLRITYVDMMTSTSPLEFTKVIVSSLDYTNEGLTRVILRKALTSTSQASRKWTTRFLSVLASSDLPTFCDWGIQLLLRQLADESSKVVRHSIRLLNRWLPENPSRNLRKVEWSVFGEAGDLLKAHIYAIESECVADEDEVRDVVRFWMNEFNQKYMKIIDEDMKEMMFHIKRSIDGGFSRASSDRPDTSFGVQAPLHLFAALGSHGTGRRILIEENIVGELLRTCTNGTCFEEIKSCLFAISSIGSTDGGFEILPLDAVPTVIKIAEEHSVLTVRGVAFWALATFSLCIEGAKRVAAFGWECNRFRYTTDLAQAKVADEEGITSTPTAGTAAGSVSSTWRPARKITMQQHRNSSILEMHVHGKQNRAKSESALVRRGHSKGRLRSQSEGDIQIVSAKKTPNSELCCTKRLWNSEIYLYKNSGTSDSSSIPYQKRTPSSVPQFQEEPVIVITPTQNPDETIGKSTANSRVSADRIRANTTNSLFEEEDTVKTRASTVARCIRDGLKIATDQLEAEGVLVDTLMEPHFSCRLREKYHLLPFRVRACVQINRHVGEPVRYMFMSKEEERHFAEYRRQVMHDPWLFNELQKEDNAVKKTINVVPLQTVALPAEIEIICGNIFPAKLKSDSIFAFHDECETTEVEDRGARTGHARSGVHIQPHSTYRCFHCSSNEDKVRTYPHSEAPSLRKEVLSQVDMLEIKEYPVKRLIGLRQLYPWLFEWPCMYADVLELLDEYRFKPHSRAFLQQIFYDALQL
uniref:RICTOR_V domain-containing protein n=1 Tax=Caenorhabditis japonica TaxID=281687 RepID=A0A8R1HTH8_CAEJA